RGAAGGALGRPQPRRAALPRADRVGRPRARGRLRRPVRRRRARARAPRRARRRAGAGLARGDGRGGRAGGRADRRRPRRARGRLMPAGDETLVLYSRLAFYPVHWFALEELAARYRVRAVVLAAPAPQLASVHGAHGTAGQDGGAAGIEVRRMPPGSRWERV